MEIAERLNSIKLKRITEEKINNSHYLMNLILKLDENSIVLFVKKYIELGCNLNKLCAIIHIYSRGHKYTNLEDFNFRLSEETSRYSDQFKSKINEIEVYLLDIGDEFLHNLIHDEGLIFSKKELNYTKLYYDKTIRNPLNKFIRMGIITKIKNDEYKVTYEKYQHDLVIAFIERCFKIKIN